MTNQTDPIETTKTETLDSGKDPSAPVGGSQSDMDDDAALDKILAGIDEEDTQAFVVGETPAAEIRDGETEVISDEMLRALRRDGVPQSVIDQMGENSELLFDWANKALKRQTDVDAYTEKMKALEGGVKDGDDSPKESDVSEPTDAEEESKEVTNQLDALIDELGEEAVKPILDMQQQLTDMQLQLEQANRRVAMSEVLIAVEQAAPIVLDQWGDVTEAQRAAVIERMGELGKAQPGTFESVEDLMRAAATKVLGKPSVTKRSTTPSPPRRVAKLDRPASIEDREDAALDVLLGGGTADQARQASMR